MPKFREVIGFQPKIKLLVSPSTSYKLTEDGKYMSHCHTRAYEKTFGAHVEDIVHMSENLWVVG